MIIKQLYLFSLYFHKILDSYCYKTYLCNIIINDNNLITTKKMSKKIDFVTRMAQAAANAGIKSLNDLGSLTASQAATTATPSTSADERRASGSAAVKSNMSAASQRSEAIKTATTIETKIAAINFAAGYGDFTPGSKDAQIAAATKVFAAAAEAAAAEAELVTSITAYATVANALRASVTETPASTPAPAKTTRRTRMSQKGCGLTTQEQISAFKKYITKRGFDGQDYHVTITSSCFGVGGWINIKVLDFSGHAAGPVVKYRKIKVA